MLFLIFNKDIPYRGWTAFWVGVADGAVLVGAFLVGWLAVG